MKTTNRPEKKEFGKRRVPKRGRPEQKDYVRAVNPLNLIRTALRGCNELLAAESSSTIEMAALKNDVADALLAANRLRRADLAIAARSRRLTRSRQS
jgi:hypothetical protein